jgi:hypothetical protein
VSKHEFIEIYLKVPTAYSVVSAEEPLLEVSYCAIRERNGRRDALAEFGSWGLDSNNMFIAGPFKTSETLKTVRGDRRARKYIPTSEVVHCCALEVRDDLHPNAARRSSASLDCNQNQGCFTSFELAAAAETRLSAANPCLIHFYFSAKRFAGHVHHGPAELVEDHPGRFVATKTKLALKKRGRETALVSCHKVCRPEPDSERSLRVVKNRS